MNNTLTINKAVLIEKLQELLTEPGSLASDHPKEYANIRFTSINNTVNEIIAELEAVKISRR